MRTRVFFSLICAFLGFCIYAARANAQMTTVDPTGVTTLQACPSNLGFYSDQNNQPACSTGTISCPNTAPIDLTWSITNSGGTAGTIVFFTGGGGGECCLVSRRRATVRSALYRCQLSGGAGSVAVL
jgi:hypothetical protein